MKIICCDTCAYNGCNKTFECLILSEYKIKWCKNGEEYIGKYRYFYYLWKPYFLWESKNDNYLPDDLFEI